jgi:hypothetical protein
MEKQTQIAYPSGFDRKRGHAICQAFHANVLFMPIEAINVVRHSFRKWRLVWTRAFVFLRTWAYLRRP